ncbi:MFS transporter [Parafrankia sp. BMG5.11]|uniref:MFS transporter n=3 Tax=unclassified Parafrankia TaxID=2994368 RepID=UPI00103A2458|nr:MFS transporter [Parafrankia sp. BMG5.11]TCJ34793.1 MFS transporter [Parafrankia sp. BMG5.11]
MRSRQARPETPTGGGALAVLALASAAFSLAQTAIVPGLGALTEALHTTPENISWVLSAYLVSAAILTPIVGRLGDMFGKRRMLVVALAAFAVGNALAALAPNVWLLILARVVQGAGGGIFPLCFGLINDTFSAKRRPGALGLVSAISGIGAGGGLIMGGLLVDHASWEWVFWAGTIMSGGAALGALRLRDSAGRTPGRIDLPGAVLLALGLTAPLIAITRTPSWGWGSPRTLGVIAAGLAVLGFFGWYERRVTEPLVDMRLLGRPEIMATNFATALVGFGTFGAFVLVPRLSQTPESSGYGFGLDATGAGLLLLPACGAMLVTAGVSGRLALRVDSRDALITGFLISATGLTALAFEHSSEGVVIALSVVLFGGIGMIMAAVPNIIVRAVPPAMTGQATGVNTLVRSVGSAVGSQVAATLLAASVTATHPLPTDGAFTLAFLLGGGGAVSAAVSAVFIPRRSRGGAPAVSSAPAAPSAPPVAAIATAAATVTATAAVTATTPATTTTQSPAPAPSVTRTVGDQAD